MSLLPLIERIFRIELLLLHEFLLQSLQPLIRLEFRYAKN